MISFRLLALVGLAVLAYAVPLLARLAGQDPAAASWLAVASPFTLVHGIAGGHVDLVLAGLLACSVLTALRRRWLLAAVLVGLAAAVKVPALLAVAPVALASGAAFGSWRSRMWAGASVGGVAIAVLFALGPLSGFGNGWVNALHATMSGGAPLSFTTQVGRIVGQLVGQPMVGVTHALGAIAIALIAMTALLTGAAAAMTAAAAVRRGALVLTVAVLLSPVEHFWYLFWALPLLAAAEMGTSARRVVVAITTALALLAPFDASQRLPASTILMELGVLLALLASLGPSRLVGSFSTFLRSPRQPARVHSPKMTRDSRADGPSEVVNTPHVDELPSLPSAHGQRHRGL